METISVNIPANYGYINSLDEFVLEAIEQKLAKKSYLAEVAGDYIHGPFTSNNELFAHLNKD